MAFFEQYIGKMSDKKDRIDRIANKNAVKLFFRKSPKGKPYSTSTVAEAINAEWHTARRAVYESLGKDVNGKLEKTTDNGRELFFRDPPACEVLVVARTEAEKEGKTDLASKIGELMAHYCRV